MCDTVILHTDYVCCVKGLCHPKEFFRQFHKHIEDGIENVLLDVGGRWVLDEINFNIMSFCCDKKLNMSFIWCKIDLVTNEASNADLETSVKLVVEDSMLNWIYKFKYSINKKKSQRTYKHKE
jgi:hypothetical protein